MWTTSDDSYQSDSDYEEQELHSYKVLLLCCLVFNEHIITRHYCNTGSFTYILPKCSKTVSCADDNILKKGTAHRHQNAVVYMAAQ